MSSNSINNCLTNNRIWTVASIIMLGWYLFPLFSGTFYVPIFDNLDSTVVWYKILAHSGKVFAPNDAIIPNMMNGLPRSSYGSEFDIVLWFYYFFKAQTAFRIHEILIHIIAFFSMFIFLKRYAIKPNKYYGLVPVYIGALYFALLPFWSGAGASIPLLPLVTYSLLNIKNHQSSKWDWALLVLLPLYTSFIFLYMFYIVLAGIYLLYDTIRNRLLNKSFFTALFLMGVVFLLSEYRLVHAMFVDPSFVSHRVEFDIFFKEDLWECYRLSLVNFLMGHIPHAQSLQMKILPLILISMLLLFIHRRLSLKESLLVWGLIIVSLGTEIWDIILINKFTLPSIALLSLTVFYFQRRFRTIPLLMIMLICLALYASLYEYDGLAWISNTFPILKTFNMIRMLFVEPFIYVIILSLIVVVFYRKLQLTSIFIWVFILLQFQFSLSKSFYQPNPTKGYASFENYYGNKAFDELKKTIPLKNSKLVSYGMEPAISQYHNLHTVDGYSANYPLSYKHQFKKVFDKYISSDLYNHWGSKVYILSVPSEAKYYQKGLLVRNIRFDTDALYSLGTTHIISPYLFEKPSEKNITLIKEVKGENDSWDLYLYILNAYK